MKNLKLKEAQTYFDPETNEPLQIWFGMHQIQVDNLIVKLDGVPLLINESTQQVYLPDKTKCVIKYFVEEAKARSKAVLTIKPKEIKSKRYPFSKKVKFIYSQIDYEYIPGLARSWDEGFLTPVFFSLSILNKYSQHPEYELDIFSESYGSIRKGENWSVKFGINKNKKVIIWLGDIDSLPNNEKHYLRSENIDSDHDIHSEFYDAQIDVKWSNPSKQSVLFHRRRELKELVFKKINFDLYMLDGEVSKVFENLHRPIFWEDKHVGPIVESFNRIFVESLNTSRVKADILAVSPEIDLKGRGSLKVFELWLLNRIKLSNHEEIMCPFYVLYDFRIIICHLQSEESRAEKLKSINKRLGIPEENINNEIIYDSLIDSLSKSYSVIIYAATEKLAGNSIMLARGP